MSTKRHAKYFCLCMHVHACLCTSVNNMLAESQAAAQNQRPSPWTSDKKMTTFHFTAPPSLFLSLLFTQRSLYLCHSTWLAILSHVPADGRLWGSLAGCQRSTGEQGTCSWYESPHSSLHCVTGRSGSAERWCRLKNTWREDKDTELSPISSVFGLQTIPSCNCCSQKCTNELFLTKKRTIIILNAQKRSISSRN